MYVIDGHKALDQLAVTADGTLQALTPPGVSTVDYPGSVGMGPDGGELIATELSGEEAAGVVQSFERRPDGTLSATTSKTAPSGDLPWELAISPDGQNAYVTSRLSSGPRRAMAARFRSVVRIRCAHTGVRRNRTRTRPDRYSDTDATRVRVESRAVTGPRVQPHVDGEDHGPGTDGQRRRLSPGARKRHEGESFAFDASLSVDPGGKIVAYRWMLGGRVISTTSRFHRFFSNSRRIYSITLTVLDDKGQSASTVLSVSPRARRAPALNVTNPATASFCVECAQPSSAATSLLRRLRRYARGARLVSISSYSDATGTRAYDLALTRRRSQAIAGLLLSGLTPAPRQVHPELAR